MRIAYLTSDFGVPVLGTKGASVHVRRMVGALGERGHEVRILTPNRGSGAHESRPLAIEEIPFSGTVAVLHEELGQEELASGNRLSKDLRNVFYSLWLQSHAAPLLQEFAPDFLYERYTLFGTAGVELARRLGVPLILEVNAPLVEEQREQRGLSLPRMAVAAQRLVFEQADEVLVVSRWLEGYVRSHGAHEGHVTVIPNAADPELFHPRPGPSEIRRRLGWEDRIVLGFVGAMKPWHGVPTLVEALALLGAPGSAFRLLLVGDGPDLPAVRARVTSLGLDPAVHYAGAVSHHEIPEWLGAADIALVPYSSSAAPYFSPVKLFECMSMGLPVVAARLGQTEEVVEHGRTGWLYSASDPGEPAATLRRVAADLGAAARVGAAARERILAEHTWARNAERVEGLVGRALGRRGRLERPALPGKRGEKR